MRARAQPKRARQADHPFRENEARRFAHGARESRVTRFAPRVSHRVNYRMATFLRIAASLSPSLSLSLRARSGRGCHWRDFTRALDSRRLLVKAAFLFRLRRSRERFMRRHEIGRLNLTRVYLPVQRAIHRAATAFSSHYARTVLSGF